MTTLPTTPDKPTPEQEPGQPHKVPQAEEN